MFIRSHYRTLSWARLIQATFSRSRSGNTNLILSYHLRPGLHSCHYPSDFQRKFCMRVSRESRKHTEYLFTLFNDAVWSAYVTWTVKNRGQNYLCLLQYTIPVSARNY
jgi:hypothetical protein